MSRARTMTGAPHLTRRRLLGGAAAAAALSPFVPILESEAQTAVKKRLVTWFTPNGTIYPEWKPQGTVTDFTFGRILAPLEAHKDKLIIVDGLRFGDTGPGSRHQKGVHAMFAGSELLNGNFGGGGGASAGWGSHTSVDQEAVKTLAQGTTFDSLALIVSPDNNNVRQRMSYTGENQPIVPEMDPSDLFGRVFGGVAQNTGDGDGAAEQLRLEKRSVLDLVKNEISSLAPRFGVADRVKLEGHLESLRAIELRLENTNFGGCSTPSVAGGLDPEDDYVEVGTLFMDLMAAVFACDASRVISFMWSGATSQQSFPWLGINGKHHDISHRDTESGPIEDLTVINTWYSEQFAYFLDKLTQIPEGSGSVLDSSLLLWGNEIGLGGRHTKDQIPIVLAGSAGGYFQTGRMLSYDKVLNNRLLVSVLHAMGGEDVETFGNMDREGSGPLSGLA